MATKKQNSHTSTRKKAASKAAKTPRKSKTSKTKERPAWLKKRDELTLKMFQEIYEDYQQGKFHRIL
jgi:hypothetical protein